MMGNERGFTLIEMLIVLLIISVLLIITIPNIAQHQSTIRHKGCEAYVKLVEAQVQAYYLDKGDYPGSLEELINTGYLNEETNTCPKDEEITISNGVVEPPKSVKK